MLLYKNEVIIPSTENPKKEDNTLKDGIKRFVDETEEQDVFKWFYEKLDTKTNFEFWRELRNPPKNHEKRFLDSIYNEKLVYKPEDQDILEIDLYNHITYRPNQNNFKVWLFQRIPDSTNNKILKSIKNKIAEQPILVDSTKILSVVESMENYLYSEGYLDAQVQFFNSSQDEKSTIRYYAYNLKPYYIKNLEYQIEDVELNSLFKQNEIESFLRPGDRLKAANYDLEKGRITNLFRNNGYMNFLPNYISELQTLERKDSLQLILKISNPSDTSYFKKFYHGNVRVEIDPDKNIDSGKDKIKGAAGNYTFILPKNTPSPLKEEILMDRINIQENQLFSRRDIDIAKRQLNSLGIFKFIYINPQIDSSNEEIINYDVRLQSLNKISFGYDLDINTASASATSQGPLLGSTFRTNLKNRNMFSGAEIWDSFIEFGVDYNLSRNQGDYQPIAALNIRFQNDLILPKLSDWNRTFHLFSKAFNIVEEKDWEYVNRVSKSKISLAYDFKKQINFLQYHLFSASYGIEYSNEEKQEYTQIQQASFYFLDPKTDEIFDSVVLKNPVYRLSFVQQVFSSFVIGQLDHSRVRPFNVYGEQSQFRYFFETSGLEILALQEIYHAISGNNQDFTFINDINFTKFIKARFNYSFIKKLNEENSVGFRFRTGFLVPINNSSPYIKSFFTGGANGIRAWAERDVGPGSTRPQDSDSELPPYQVGDVIFDLISEYRFPIFYYLKGAIFLDAGNIWTFSEEDSREGARLSNTFYRDIAVGTGIGLRFDISYAVIRFDVGQKLRLPYLNEQTQNHWAIKHFDNLRFDDLNFNLAIGYPF